MESKQLIIAVSREFGSGGHCIAEELARRFALPLYDRNILEEIADEKNVDSRNLEKYDELPKNHLFSRTVRGFSNSPEEQIANMQFDFLRKKAEEGASFVIVGRCAETILKGNPGLITIFVLGDMDAKIKRIAGLHLISRAEAERMIWRHDRKRKAYHNHYCEMKWGDSRNYDLCINSNKLGIERTTDTLEQYIRERMK
ncbi:cytidylate kinase-like family protein [Butyricicoccus porcorum]|uniref:Cytidylate kinase n=1 Tax=Butyricicoccus porcorum TaxID=1945634 RepID=A0A252F3J0_9FIRM|nr:cytidylate kinase-like family protein [Butyricicoccus porcorum]MCI6925650.1 cytidylate kinase-like family protein [Butyricicoccus porcorum]MDD6986551.1 cytidylate kinase-like family protein [Butyricicoccus porcorum]MDY4482528.1 cytidylate kinase-like family protein [Butyricicoccus porcorum]OUM20365.1 cytidylate kinase [Butyricicoccus porcorum]